MAGRTGAWSNEEQELILIRFHVWRRRVGLIPFVIVDGEQRHDEQEQDANHEHAGDDCHGAHVKNPPQ